MMHFRPLRDLAVGVCVLACTSACVRNSKTTETALETKHMLPDRQSQSAKKNISLNNSINISRNTIAVTQTKWWSTHAHIMGMFHGPVHSMPGIGHHRLDAFKPALVPWHNAQRRLSERRFSHHLHWDPCHTVLYTCQSNTTQPLLYFNSFKTKR